MRKYFSPTILRDCWLTRARRPLSRAIFFLSIFAFLLHPGENSAAQFLGTLKEVTVTDSAGGNKPPASVINFTKNGGIFTFDASASSDSDGSIVQYMWDFGDGATASGINISHSYSQTGKYPVTLTITDSGGAISVAQLSITKSFSVAVNFQPAAETVPTGFVVDAGLVYTQARGYGWSKAVYGVRIRNSKLSPSKEYDTIAILNNSTTQPTWRYDLPNGRYSVRLCIGDPSYIFGPFTVAIEGTVFINSETPSTSNRWIEKEVTVDVLDGNIVVDFAGSAANASACWINISQIL